MANTRIKKEAYRHSQSNLAQPITFNLVCISPFRYICPLYPSVAVNRLPLSLNREFHLSTEPFHRICQSQVLFPRRLSITPPPPLPLPFRWPIRSSLETKKKKENDGNGNGNGNASGPARELRAFQPLHLPSTNENEREVRGSNADFTVESC